jgi:hypothetical protein
MKHTHDDDRLTFGCAGCVADAEQARWDNAPLCRVAWHCSYFWADEVTRHNETLSFTLDVRVPDGVDPWKLDERYADVTGEAFVMALPERVPMDSTAEACKTMEVERIVIGERVDLPAPVEQDRLPL